MGDVGSGRGHGVLETTLRNIYHPFHFHSTRVMLPSSEMEHNSRSSTLRLQSTRSSNVRSLRKYGNQVNDCCMVQCQPNAQSGHGGCGV